LKLRLYPIITSKEAQGDRLSRIVKILLFLVFFGLFFEAGLFASYTIVTQQPPDPTELIEMQLNALSSLFNFGGPTLSTQKTLKVLNPDEVAENLKNKAGIDGVNLETLSAQTTQDTSKSTITVNLTATGYKDAQTGGTTGNSSSGPIVIKANETYSITATATGKLKTTGIQVDVATIQIISIRKLYNN
jgi:hypothetical protein